MSEVVLNEYDQLRDLCEGYTQRLSELLDQLLAASSIHVHSVTFRLKTRESLKKKLYSTQDKYESLEDVTDICGVRVTTYFADDVDRVAEIVENEFEIDVGNSVDKRALLDPDRFGYISVHYVVGLSAVRSELTEYQDFRDLKAEVQIRSISSMLGPRWSMSGT